MKREDLQKAIELQSKLDKLNDLRNELINLNNPSLTITVEGTTRCGQSPFMQTVSESMVVNRWDSLFTGLVELLQTEIGELENQIEKLL